MMMSEDSRVVRNRTILGVTALAVIWSGCRSAGESDTYALSPAQFAAGVPVSTEPEGLWSVPAPTVAAPVVAPIEEPSDVAASTHAEPRSRW